MPTLATKRVQINVPTYMQVDGQWQIVYPGSVVDLPANVVISPSCTVTSFSEAPGNLADHGKTTSVRNLRVR